MHFGLTALAVIFADFFFVFIGFQGVHAITSYVANRDTRFFGILPGQFGQLLAPLLGHVRDWQADILPIGDRVQAQPCAADRFFNGRDIAAVPHLHRQQPRFGRRHGCHLVQRHIGPVNLVRYRIKQAGIGAAGAQPRKITFQRIECACHAAFQIILVIGWHVHSPSY